MSHNRSQPTLINVESVSIESDFDKIKIKDTDEEYKLQLTKPEEPKQEAITKPLKQPITQENIK